MVKLILIICAIGVGSLVTANNWQSKRFSIWGDNLKFKKHSLDSSTALIESNLSSKALIMSIRGGDVGEDNDPNGNTAGEGFSFKRTLLGLWGVTQVVLILGNAIRRLVPIALQPFQSNDLQQFHWVLYSVWCVIMAYSEGYKAFQLKFAPLVVSRAFSLHKNASILNCLLSGPYCMGMFNAERKRIIVAWALTAGIFATTILVKYLPYPYRSIVDGGVVVGLSYGTLAICFQTIAALFRRKSD